jgi:hypothetical protein
VELSSSQPPRLLPFRTRSLGRAPKKKKKKKKKNKKKRKKKRFYLEEDFEVLGNFPGTKGRIAKSWQIFLPCSDYQEDPFALLQ